MATNLILTGGIFHPFETAAPALADILDEAGIQSVIRYDIDEALSEMADGRSYDMVTVFALRWRMLDHEKYKPYRDEWALSLSGKARQALKAHVMAGGGLLGLHTATICFDDWPEWQALLGGRWIWGTSYHPPLDLVEVHFEDENCVLTRGLGDFRIQDEVYHHLDCVPGVTPLIVAQTAEGEGPQTVGWAHESGQGRVVYDGLGHDADALGAPEHRRFIKRAALWITGKSEKEILKQ